MKRKLKLYLVQRDIGNERVCWLGSDMMAMAFRNVRKLMMLVTISIARESLQDSSRRFPVSVVLVPRDLIRHSVQKGLETFVTVRTVLC